MNSPFSDFIDTSHQNDSVSFSEVELMGPFSDQSELDQFLPEIEGEDLTGKELENAVALNEKYKRLYKWDHHLLLILPQIGAKPSDYPVILSDPKEFAKAFARWQEKNGYKGSNRGVLGLNNWTYLQKKMGFHNLSNRFGINVQQAIAANKTYESKLWSGRREDIYRWLRANKVIVMDLPLNDEYFAYAVADFQSQKGLQKDGKLGPATWDLLQKTTIPAPVPTVAITPSRWRNKFPDAVQSPAEPLVNGVEAFKQIAEAIKTVKGKGHFIYLLSGWVAEFDFCLSPNPSKDLAPFDQSSTFQNLLKNINNDVEIKIISWNNPKTLDELDRAEKIVSDLKAAGKNIMMHRDNFTYGTELVKNMMKKIQSLIKMVDFGIPALNAIDGWKKIKAMAKAFPNQGSHHEKILIVNGSEGLIAFTGGMDLNANRIMGLKGFCCGNYMNPFHDCDLEKDSGGKMRSSILHDVHCKVRGKAAEALLKRFIQRWNLHIAQFPYIPQLPAPAPAPVIPVSTGTPYVKVLHTFNHPLNKSIKDRSILNAVETLIKNARSSIAMECQYMISPEIADWLNKAIRANEKLKISLYTQDDEFANELMFVHYFRRRFREVLYRGLNNSEKNRIKIFMLDPESNPPVRRRVHSKAIIVDEEIAIIGSANCNRRSMTFDSETAVIFFQDGDPAQSIVKKLNDKIRNDKYNKWIPYKENLSKEALDLDVKIQLNPYFNTGVSLLSIPLGIGAPLTALQVVKNISVLLKAIIDPHPEGEPIITKEVNEELAEVLAETEAFTENFDTTASSIDTEEAFSVEDGETEEEVVYDEAEADSDCNCHKRSQEVEDSEREMAEVIEQQVAVSGNACEGRTCWAKSVLNGVSGVSLALNNTLDQATVAAIGDFQLKNNLPQTKKIDAATERALLEADAIRKTKGTVSENAAINIISSAKTKIEDWTAEGQKNGVKNKPQHILNSFRDPRKVWAFVLHQMAFKRKGGPKKQYSAPEGYVNTGAHFCIMFDGRIIQLHPVSRMIWHGNCISPRSVGVEFEGNFPNIKGKWWIDKKSSVQNKDVPTQAQYDAGRFLASYLKVVLGTTHILAHRQSSDSRENDPGPDIWYQVGEWAMKNLGMTDGGSSFKCGTGNPILPEWRTWGDKTATMISKEHEDAEEETDWEEEFDVEATYAEPEMIEESMPEEENLFF